MMTALVFSSTTLFSISVTSSRTASIGGRSGDGDTMFEFGRSMILLAFLFAFVAVPVHAAAQPAKEFYRGKTVSLLVGGTAGGGVDVSARVLAKHFGRHIPGQPTVVPQLMPGAGGIRAIDYMNSAAARDGTVLVLLPPGPLLEPLIGKRKASYRMADFQAIGAMTRELSLCVAWYRSKFKSIEDAQQNQMIVAGTGAASTTNVYPVVLNELLGTKFKIITGFQGSQESTLAIERGEVDGRCGWGWSSIKSVKSEWVRDRKLNILLQFALTRSAEFPDAPSVMELIKDDTDRRAMSLLLAPLVLNKPVFVPPGVPSERISELRSAFKSVMNDPELRAEVVKLSSEEPDPTAGEEAQKIVADMYATPEVSVDRLRRILSK
jgi:tripartite-type tricarboxylate transporter receptor subunit TctC